MNILAIFCAFSFYSIPNEPVIADTTVPVYLPCRIFGLQTNQSSALIGSKIPGLSLVTGTNCSYGTIGTVEKDVDDFDVLPDVADESSSKGV